MQNYSSRVQEKQKTHMEVEMTILVTCHLKAYLVGM